VERVRVPHGLCDAASRFYIDEGTFADSRAPLRGLQPCAFVIHEFRPERESLALQWFGRMDGTAIGLQEGALDVARNAEPAQVFGAIDVAALENRGFDVQKGGEADDIVLSQVDETLLFAAFCAAGLALKSQVSQV
jgi:hypothetical protein